MNGRTLAHRLWIAITLGHLLGYLSLAYLARSTGPLAIDYSIRAFLQTTRETALDRMIRAWAVFGDWQILSVALICLSLFLSRDVRRQFLFFFVLALGGAGLVGQLTKVVVGRLRPGDARLGFPSGHTIAAMVTVCGLLYFGARGGLLRRSAARAASAGAGLLIVLGVGVSRMYTDSHWLTDICGGILLGAAVSAGVALVLEGRGAVWQPMTTSSGSSKAGRQ